MARLSPHMIRVDLRGPEALVLPADAAGGHCKLFLPEPGEAARPSPGGWRTAHGR